MDGDPFGEENAVGVTLASEDPYQMAQQIKDLFLEPERLKEMQINGPKAASKYDRKILARKMLSILEQSIKKREHKT